MVLLITKNYIKLEISGILQPMPWCNPSPRLDKQKIRRTLAKLATELVNRDGNCSLSSVKSFSEWDSENVMGSMQIPVLVIGTKLDQEDNKKSSLNNSNFASSVGADEIVLDCRQVRYLAAGTSNAVKLTRFYDKVIEKRCQTGSASPFGERYINSTAAPILSSKFYSPSHVD